MTNHKDLLPGLDGRSATARRFRDLVNAFVADMGGLDRCSEIRLGLVRRLAATTVQAEMLEARMVNGEAIDIATLCTLASTTVRFHSVSVSSVERATFHRRLATSSARSSSHEDRCYIAAKVACQSGAVRPRVFDRSRD